MKLIYKEIRIRMRDGACILTKQVPAWELPVLQAVWGDGVTELRDIIVEIVKPPTSQGEFDRLARVYSFERDEGGSKGMPFVEAVYGQHGAGVGRLKAAMLASIADQSAVVTPREAPPVLNSELAEAIKVPVLETRPTAEAAADLIG